MKNNLKMNTRLLSSDKSFNNKLTKIVNEKNIPMDISFDLEVDISKEIDVIIVDKEFYLKYGLEELHNKTKYILYKMDEMDNNIQFIKELYNNNVFDILHSSFIPKSIERKLWAFIRLIREEDTNQLLDVILDSIEDSIAITDEEGALEYVNKGFLKTTGYSLNEVIGENPRILKSEEHTEAFYKELWDTIIRGDIWHGNFINLSKSDDFIYEEAIVYPIELSSKKYLKIAHNITKERFLENKVTLNISIAKNVLVSSAPNSYKDSKIEFNYFIKYMNALGGDFIWFDKISNGKYILVLIDVTGHDLSSSLILMTIINIIKEYKGEESLGKLIEKINKYLDDFNGKTGVIKLISGIFCVIDIEKSQLEYINAGHPEGLLFDKESQNLIELKGNTMLLGVKSNLSFETILLPIDKASDLVLYSDGLLEYFIEDYTKMNPATYKNIFYGGNQLKFSSIKEEIMRKEHIKDDLSLAHIKFQTIGDKDDN